MPTHKPSSVSPLGAVAKDDRSTSLPDANLPAAELLATLRDGLNLDDPSQTASTALARDDARSSSLSDWSATGTNASVSDVENERFAEPQQAREWSDSEADTEKLVMTPRAALPPTEIATVSSGLSRDVPSEASSSDSDSTSQATPSHPKHTPSELAGRKRKRLARVNSRDSALSEASDSDQALASRRVGPLRLNATLHPSGVSEASMSPGIQDEPDLVTQMALGSSTKRSSRKPATKTARKGAALRRVQSSLSIAQETSLTVASPTGTDIRPLVDEDVLDNDATTSVEDIRKRADAADAFQGLSRLFASLRKREHADKIAAVEQELADLQRPFPAHADYIAQMQCITARRDLRMRQEARLQHYRKQALRNETLATRAQLHSQYCQEARDIRDTVLYDLGKQWYATREERRNAQADDRDKYMYKLPENRSDRLRNQAKYNQEVSILSGVAKYIGFPAAPDMQGARTCELDDDLKAMKIPRKTSVAHTAETNGQGHKPRGTVGQRSDHAVGKASLDDTAGVTSRQQIHQTPTAMNSFGFDDHSRGSSLVAGIRRSSVPRPDASSPMATPTATNFGGKSGHDYAYNHDTNPASRANMSNVNHTAYSGQSKHNDVGDGSPTAPAKRALPRQDGNGTHMETPAGDKRNFSGLSSTSTIEAGPPSDPMTGPGPDDQIGQASMQSYGQKSGHHEQHPHMTYSSATYATPRGPEDGLDRDRPSYASHGLRVAGVGVGDASMSGI